MNNLTVCNRCVRIFISVNTVLKQLEHVCSNTLIFVFPEGEKAVSMMDWLGCHPTRISVLSTGCSLLLAACSLLHAPCSLVPAPCTCWPPSSRCSTGSCGRLGAGVIRWKFDWKFIQQWEFTVTRKPPSPNQYCTSPSPPPVLAARFPNEHRGCSFSEQQCYPCCSNRCRQVCDHRHVEDCRTAVLKCIMYIRELCAL